jgi:hypothetical protein
VSEQRARIDRAIAALGGAGLLGAAVVHLGVIAGVVVAGVGRIVEIAGSHSQKDVR